MEVSARKSFMSIWKVKQENSVLREAVVPSSEEVIRTDETGDMKFYLGCFIIVLTGSEGNGLHELLILVPTTLAVPERQACPLTGSYEGSIGKQSQGESLPLQIALQHLPWPWHYPVLQCISQKNLRELMCSAVLH